MKPYFASPFADMSGYWNQAEEPGSWKYREEVELGTHCRNFRRCMLTCDIYKLFKIRKKDKP